MFRKLALSAALLGAATTANAQMLTAADPEGIAQAMARSGFAVNSAQSSDGSPALLAVHPDVNFRVFFLGCTEGAACQHLLFSAQYTIEGDLDPTKLDSFMALSALGGAHLSTDESETTTLRYFVTTVGGMPKEQFAEVLFLWRVANQTYLRTIAPPAEEAEDDG